METTTTTSIEEATTPPVVSPPVSNTAEETEEKGTAEEAIGTPDGTNAAAVATPITANASSFSDDADSSKSVMEEETGEETAKTSEEMDTARGDSETESTKALEDVKTPTTAKRAPPADVIELLDDDDEDEKTASSKNDAKRPRVEQQVSSSAMASYQARLLPTWMHKPNRPPAPTTASASLKQPPPYATSAAAASPQQPLFLQNAVLNVPHYVDFPTGFSPTWGQVLPAAAQPQPLTAHTAQGPRIYNLSLLNVKEFSIEGLPSMMDGPPTPVTGLRKPLRQICRAHQVKPEYSNSRWRIPLAAYHAVATYLQNLPSKVYGIPANQLQIATLERERQDKGYPTPDALMDAGLPRGLAHALADFQRGGVDFVRTKGGRALVADDMGLGKTIQGVASMALYRDEWPVLILCPSGARYHWEHEFRHWLGVNSPINKKERSVFVDTDQTDTNGLLQDWQINVLTSSKDKLLPSKKTKVVICSYGLVVSLIQSNRLRPGMFGCAVVDESHMLKNKSSKRTCALVPILQQTQRCVLLSGTPALARPSELWPQLSILNSTNAHGWDISEDEYIRKYVKAGNRRAELHTMMTATVMIRRLKVDMLENLPSKCRQVARVNVVEPSRVAQFRELLLELQQGKGVLGTLAKIHAAETKHDEQDITPSDHDLPPPTEEQQRRTAEMEQHLEQGRARIAQSIQQQGADLSPRRRHELQMELEGNLRLDLERQYGERQQQQQHDERKKNVLSQLYSLTGDVKIPLIVDFLKRWLKNKTKGKICIFAHHISVLDAIEKGCRLDNKKRPFIRIDGSTSAKLRQEQISRYQTNPAVRVALLGITAAGVAVTLTASSTVLFAELFWTPALMIQAEDRCHRIGQSARVNCLYLVAKGTLDDVLWRLIEKKFRDLGEFVEGKERLRLVVEKTFSSTKELYADTFALESAEDDDDDDDDNFKLDDIPEFQLDSELVDDIEALAADERKMLQRDMEDGDEGDAGVADFDSKPAAVEETPVAGQSEEDAIALLDDDDEEEQIEKPASDAAKPAAAAPLRRDNANDILGDSRLYKMIFNAPTLGIELAFQSGRIFVSQVKPERRMALGDDSKPGFGDILVAINGTTLALVPDLTTTIHTLRYYLQRPPLELMFLEAPRFAKAIFALTQRQQIQAALAPPPPPSAAAAPAPSPKPPKDGGDDDVIELLDDD